MTSKSLKRSRVSGPERRHRSAVSEREDLLYALIPNRFCNTPAEDQFTPMERSMDALFRAYSFAKRTKEIPFSSVSSLLRQCDYKDQHANRKRAESGLRFLKRSEGSVVRSVQYRERHNDFIVQLRDDALNQKRKGMTPVPLPLPKGSEVAVNLFLVVMAWVNRPNKEFDLPRLCKMVGIKERKRSRMMASLELALRSVNKHLRSFTPEERNRLLTVANISLPRPLQLKEVGRPKVAFVDRSKERAGLRRNRKFADDEFDEASREWMLNEALKDPGVNTNNPARLRRAKRRDEHARGYSDPDD